MPDVPPSWVSYTFLFAVAVGLVAVLTALRLTARSFWAAAAMRSTLALWLGVPAVLAMRGTLLEFDARPPMLMRVVVPMALLVVGFSLSRLGRKAAEALPLTLLVGAQAFRVPVEIALHGLFRHQVLPREMTFEGYNFDIATGITAVLLWALLHLRGVPRWVVFVWNTVGLLLLCTIVTLAILAFPEPFGLFQPENRVVATFPWVWLPTFLVQLALFGHLLVYRRLSTEDSAPLPEGG